MDYKKWSQEYFNEGDKILHNIKTLKTKLNNSSADERKTISLQIAVFQSIYYEMTLTAKYLLSRAEVV